MLREIKRKIMLMKRINIMVLTAVLFFTIFTLLTSSAVIGKTTSIVAYTDHNPIVITSNNDFVTQGFDDGGTRDGTQGLPYLIEGFKITSSTPEEILILIENTDVYFVIEECLLMGSGTEDDITGIKLEHVQHARIRSNIINSTTHGIRLFQGTSSEYACSQNIIIDNTIHNCSVGIGLDTAEENYIESNTIFNLNNTGISVITSDNVLITKNSIRKSHFGTGFYFYKSDSNLITFNDIDDHSIGIWTLQSIGNEICGNAIVHNIGEAVLLDDTNATMIQHNAIVENYEGVNIFMGSLMNMIRCNNFTSNTDVGVRIANVNCIANNVTDNNFLNNNPGGTSQALDNSGDNLFLHNYWTDASGTDTDSDGYLDTPYSVAGNPGNEDPLPSATGVACGETCPTSLSPVWSSDTPGWSLMLVFVAMLPLLSLRRKK